MTVFDAGKLTLLAGPGAWGSIQSGGSTTVARFDLGPTLATRLPFGLGSFEVAADTASASPATPSRAADRR